MIIPKITCHSMTAIHVVKKKTSLQYVSLAWAQIIQNPPPLLMLDSKRKLANSLEKFNFCSFIFYDMSTVNKKEILLKNF